MKNVVGDLDYKCFQFGPDLDQLTLCPLAPIV